MDKYINHFETYAIRKHKIENNDIYIKMLKNNTEMIDHFDDLPSPLKTIQYVFNIKPDDRGYYKGYYNYYIEARERRNLLVHRGTWSDKRYFKNLKKYLSKDPKALKNILSYIQYAALKKWDGKESDISISLKYSLHSHRILYYLATVIYYHSFKLPNKGIEKNYINAKETNELLILSRNNKQKIFAELIISVFVYYHSNKTDGKLKLLPDVDKANFILSVNLYEDFGGKINWGNMGDFKTKVFNSIVDSNILNLLDS